MRPVFAVFANKTRTVRLNHDVTFSIRSVSPEGGESWFICCMYDVKWTAEVLGVLSCVFYITTIYIEVV